MIQETNAKGAGGCEPRFSWLHQVMWPPELREGGKQDQGCLGTETHRVEDGEKGIPLQVQAASFTRV